MLIACPTLLLQLLPRGFPMPIGPLICRLKGPPIRCPVLLLRTFWIERLRPWTSGVVSDASSSSSSACTVSVP